MATERITPEISLRLLRPTDLAFADSLRALAGWNQTVNDWQTFLALSSQGCFVAEWNGSPAGTATTICYGQDLAWVGMLLVHPDFRRRGIGHALLARCLEHLKAAGIRTIRLDATPEGKILYEEFGFREECSIMRCEIPHITSPSANNSTVIRPYAETDAVLLEQFDTKVFGASREPLLKRLLPASSKVLVFQSNAGLDGYGMLRVGARALYLGPLIAETPDSAKLLVSGLLANAVGQKVFWDVPQSNLTAVSMASALGFEAQRPLVRMVLGEPAPPVAWDRYFAIADPATG
jgi:GNAT superfamily N-acetyltransferase